MERKFKVGDKVRFIGCALEHSWKPEKLVEVSNNLVIDDIDEDCVGNKDIYVIYREGLTKWWRWRVHPEELVLRYENFTKDNLQPGDVVTVRNGDKLYLSSNGYFVDIEGERFNSIASRGDLTNDLLCDGDDRDSDIMKVERPTYHTVYERVEEKKEPKKMTVAEISKELGYDVEIVKG